MPAKEIAVRNDHRRYAKHRRGGNQLIALDAPRKNEKWLVI